MKKLITAVALFIAAAPAFAQTATPSVKAGTVKQQATAKVQQTAKEVASPEKRAVAYTNELKQKLTLTDDQYKKVLAVNTECIRRKDALKTGGQKGGQGSKDISTYRQQQYQSILTPAQQTKLKAINSQGDKKKAA